MVVIIMGLGVLFISAGIGQACRAGSCSFSPYDFGTAVGIALLVISAALGVLVLRSWFHTREPNHPEGPDSLMRSLILANSDKLKPYSDCRKELDSSH
jgi:hypothetical protein